MARAAIGLLCFLGAAAGPLTAENSSRPLQQSKSGEWDISNPADQNSLGPIEQSFADVLEAEVSAPCHSNTTTRECVGKAACLQMKLQNVVFSVEDLSTALDDLLKIDRLATAPEGTPAEDKRRRDLEAELAHLERQVHRRREASDNVSNVHNVSNTSVEVSLKKSKAIIKHLKRDLGSLEKQEEHALKHEVRRVSEAARRSSRDLQTAVRQTARKAPDLADRMDKAAHFHARRCEAAGDRLARRVETLADHVERKGEILARRIDDAVRSQQRRADAAVRAVNATLASAVGTSLFLAPGASRDWPLRAPVPLALAAAGALPMLAALLVARGRRHAAAVSPPDSALG